MVTRALNLLGAYLGEEDDLMKPLPENPEGFWERFDVYHLQNLLLAQQKRAWDTTSPLPAGWHTATEIRPLKQELIALVRSKFFGQPLWAWKDPRTCLLLPLWREVLSELGIGLKAVFVVRNPLDVARSLEKRNGFTLDKGFGIWFNSTIVCLKEMAGLDSVYLSYDEFLDDWETALKKCADGLKLRWPDDSSELQAKMKPFVRRELRHSVSGVEELLAVKAPDPVIRLYKLLCDLQSREATFGEVEPIVATMYEEFYGYARFFTADLDALTDCRMLLDSGLPAPEMFPSYVTMKRDLDNRTELAWNLVTETKALREQITVLLCSSSWKFTKPLRDFSDFLRRFLGKA